MMSIYSCVDDIDNMLSNGPDEPQGFWRNLLTSKKMLLDEAEKKLLETLKRLLIEADGPNANRDQELAKVIGHIMVYKQDNNAIKPPQFVKFLSNIEMDLKIIKGDILGGQLSQEDQPDNPLKNQYNQLVNSPLLFKSVKQVTQDIGNSKGECYGITMSMAVSTSNPYKTGNEIVFNRTIHDYQKNQQDRSKDQQKIKSTRLTRSQFCPSFQAQAEKLYKISAEHIDEDLSVHFSKKALGHACYLSQRSNGEIWYMDPYLGAFKFDGETQFVSAYCLIYAEQQRRNPVAVSKFFMVS